MLFALLRRIDEDPDGVAFFTDELGSGQVGADWREALPAYFRCLADGASGDDFTREVDRAITGVADYQRPRPLAAARRVGNSEQKAALRRLGGREPCPPVGTRRRRLLILAEERQAFVPFRGSAVGAGVRRAWAMGLDAVVGVDGDTIRGLLDEDEHAFLLNMLVLPHAWPAQAGRPRVTLEESYRRHESVIASLAPLAEARGLPVAWHALWRLPPAMTWSEPGEKPWMRYPAVSFAAAVRPMHRRVDGKTAMGASLHAARCSP